MSSLCFRCWWRVSLSFLISFPLHVPIWHATISLSIASLSWWVIICRRRSETFPKAFSSCSGLQGRPGRMYLWQVVWAHTCALRCLLRNVVRRQIWRWRCLETWTRHILPVVTFGKLSSTVHTIYLCVLLVKVGNDCIRTTIFGGVG